MQEQADLAGHWEGRIQIAGLDFDVDFERGEADVLTGDLSIPAQNLSDLELLELTLSGDTVSFALPDKIPGEASFEGTLDSSGEVISGTFRQAGQELRFSMERAEDPIEAARAVLADFDGWMTKQMKKQRAPGATVTVVYRDRVLLAKGYGLANAETEAPVTADTVFAIGSTTKAFTTFALAQAVARGELDWDEPVRRYLLELDLIDDVAEAQLTLRDMVSHRSGLPRHDLSWYLFPEKTRPELVASLAHLEPSAGLRETWQYNNLMFLTAGVALERVTGKSWEENLREGILEPLGMKSVAFGPVEAAKGPDFASPHDREKGQYLLIPFREISKIGPAGSIHASANDMAGWLRCLLGNGELEGQRLLAADQVAELFTPISVLPQLALGRESSPLAYAMGWMIDNHRGHLRVHHGGGIDGFVTQVQLFPADALGIFVSTNRETPLSSVVASEILERVLGLDPQDSGSAAAAQMESLSEMENAAEVGAAATRIPDAPPAHPLKDYAGDYQHAGYGTAHVRLEEGILNFELGSFAGVLEPWHFETFRAQDESAANPFGKILVQFETDPDGHVAALSSSLEPSVQPIRFERQPDAALSDPALLARLVGNYQLGPQTIELRLEDERLIMEVSGQPPYSLKPGPNGRFTLAQLDGYSVGYRETEGVIDAVLLYQPNGNFVAERAN